MYAQLHDSPSFQNLTLDDLNRKQVLLLWPAIVYITVLMILGTAGNFVVLYVYTFKYKPSNHRCFILTLGVCDIITCTVCMPFLIVDATMPYQFHNIAACKIFRFITYFTALLSICTLLIISIERYRKICHPFKKQITLSDAKKLLMVVSLFSGLILSSPSAVMYGHSTFYTGIGDIHGVGCFTDDSVRHSSFPFYYNICLFILLTCFGLTMVYCYYRIACKRYMRSKSRQTRTRTPRNVTDDVISSEYVQNTSKYSVIYKLKEEFNVRKCYALEKTGTAVNFETAPARIVRSQTCTKFPFNRSGILIMKLNKNSTKNGDAKTKENNDASTKKSNDVSTNVNNDASTKNSNDVSTKEYNDASTKNSNGVSTKNSNDVSTKNSNDVSTKEYNDASTKNSNDASTKNSNDEDYVEGNDEVILSTHVDKSCGVDTNSKTDKTCTNILDSSAMQNVDECFTDNDKMKFGEGKTQYTDHLADNNIEKTDTNVVESQITESVHSIRCASESYDTCKDKCGNDKGNEFISMEFVGREKTHSAKHVVKGDGKLIRITKMLFVITTVYFISFTPHLVLMLMVLIDDSFLKSMNPTQTSFYYIVMRSFLINSVANPLILNYMDRKFRTHCRELWTHWRCKKAVL